MMKRLANFCVEKRVWILLFFILAAAVNVWLMQKVNINSDMVAYLPDSFAMKTGTEVMKDEFPESPSFRMMLKDVSAQKAAEILEEIGNMEHIANVLYEADSADYNKDGYLLYEITLDADLDTNTVDETVAKVKAFCESYNPIFTGSAITDRAGEVMGTISIFAFVILMIILFLMCESWVEPFLFLISIVIAIMINMGTNVMFPRISNITIAVAAVLQLVLSMDYSIMLLNRYRQEKQNTSDKYDAMKQALCKAIAAISSSSVTTIVGMLVLVFMSFTIGRDMGFVLAKGVFISLICIFTVLPALILIFDKLIVKTAKKSLPIKMDRIAGFGYKARIGVLIVFVLLFGASFVLQGKVNVTYSSSDYDEISKIFPSANTVVLLYDNSLEEAVDTLEQKWDGDLQVDSISSYGTTLGKELTYDEMAGAVEMDEALVAQLYYYYSDKQGEISEKTIKLGEFLTFLQTDVANNEQFGSLITDDMRMQMAALSNVDAASAETVAAMMEQPMNSDEISEYLSIDKMMGTQLFNYYAIAHNEMPDAAVAIDDFMRFIISNVAVQEPFNAYFTDEVMEKLNESTVTMDEGRSQLVGENYSRLILNTSLPVEADETFQFIAALQEDISQALDGAGGDYYLIGNSVMAYEMGKSFPDEMMLITIITAVAIFLVIAIAFRSLSIPAILVLVIQCAVFITMSSIYLQGSNIYFLPMLIVQCLLMGATVDYGILYVSYYREARGHLQDKKEAVVQALNHSIHTIVTSASILIIVTGVLGFMMADSERAISEILLTVARGGMCSTVLIIFILPGLISLFDRFVVKKGRNKDGH